MSHPLGARVAIPDVIGASIERAIRTPAKSTHVKSRCARSPPRERTWSLRLHRGDVSRVGGQIFLPPRFLADVYQLVRDANAVCIADECRPGFGRIGTHFWRSTHGVAGHRRAR